jgi:hypothetical protein
MGCRQQDRERHEEPGVAAHLRETAAGQHAEIEREQVRAEGPHRRMTLFAADGADREAAEQQHHGSVQQCVVQQGPEADRGRGTLLGERAAAQQHGDDDRR